MIEVSESLTRQVAQLARLELTALEVQTFTGQLAEILKYVEQLQGVNVVGVEPLTHPIALSNPMREDVLIPPTRDADGKPRMLRPAPEVINDGFKVPPIL